VACPDITSFEENATPTTRVLKAKVIVVAFANVLVDAKFHPLSRDVRVSAIIEQSAHWHNSQKNNVNTRLPTFTADPVPSWAEIRDRNPNINVIAIDPYALIVRSLLGSAVRFAIKTDRRAK
jgi:hypothetical protein